MKAKKIPAASAAGEGGMVEEIYILIDTLNPWKVTREEKFLEKFRTGVGRKWTGVTTLPRSADGTIVGP